MTALSILSGGAAHGLVASLAPKFKALTGLDIQGHQQQFLKLVQPPEDAAPTKKV